MAEKLFGRKNSTAWISIFNNKCARCKVFKRFRRASCEYRPLVKFCCILLRILYMCGVRAFIFQLNSSEAHENPFFQCWVFVMSLVWLLFSHTPHSNRNRHSLKSAFWCTTFARFTSSPPHFMYSSSHFVVVLCVFAAGNFSSITYNFHWINVYGAGVWARVCVYIAIHKYNIRLHAVFSFVRTLHFSSRWKHTQNMDFIQYLARHDYKFITCIQTITFSRAHWISFFLFLLQVSKYTFQMNNLEKRH